MLLCWKREKRSLWKGFRLVEAVFVRGKAWVCQECVCVFALVCEQLPTVHRFRHHSLQLFSLIQRFSAYIPMAYLRILQ